ncbi:hypothetical protein K440DRAFT_18417 [Wilcoxina mikolae CBS 423.85]|nr:hypothetical protein K440DRAFT_18417 [Wilcoxina mikolae CBS 423.85]
MGCAFNKHTVLNSTRDSIHLLAPKYMYYLATNLALLLVGGSPLVLPPAVGSSSSSSPRGPPGAGPLQAEFVEILVIECRRIFPYCLSSSAPGEMR